MTVDIRLCHMINKMAAFEVYNVLNRIHVVTFSGVSSDWSVLQAVLERNRKLVNSVINWWVHYSMNELPYSIR